MSVFGHNTVLSDSTMAKLCEPGWTPTVLACCAVILIGWCLILFVRECAE